MNQSSMNKAMAIQSLEDEYGIYNPEEYSHDDIKNIIALFNQILITDTDSDFIKSHIIVGHI